ncbi:hypothetical protein M011DRAFT_156080 [Sporormia fimetaria CBS 119925]|uniref:Uncharacterized protein n=1 Tax=Sporormia fimetaria CBS 119925 TaxID=1340428 RepID=A0A6A6V5E6_9PLEO|nr:hypothetical protein M011DRAFT_156080 [Sporormia fimetaria CBS 119925]
MQLNLLPTSKRRHRGWRGFQQAARLHQERLFSRTSAPVTHNPRRGRSIDASPLSRLLACVMRAVFRFENSPAQPQRPNEDLRNSFTNTSETSRALPQQTPRGFRGVPDPTNTKGVTATSNVPPPSSRKPKLVFPLIFLIGQNPLLDFLSGSEKRNIPKHAQLMQPVLRVIQPCFVPTSRPCRVSVGGRGRGLGVGPATPISRTQCEGRESVPSVRPPSKNSCIIDKGWGRHWGPGKVDY